MLPSLQDFAGSGAIPLPDREEKVLDAKRKFMERVRAELARGDEDAELEVEERTVQRTEGLRGHGDTAGVDGYAT